jgi:hypothetical protein
MRYSKVAILDDYGPTYCRTWAQVVLKQIVPQGVV